jgi:hypothetical protein
MIKRWSTSVQMILNAVVGTATRPRSNMIDPRYARVIGVLLIVGACFAGILQAQSSAFTSLSFYIGGHEDDWELFRGDVAYNEVSNIRSKVVFIYATAGDAGRTDGWWEARERGAVAAVRKAVGPAPLTVSVARFDDHPIIRYTSRNTTSYFLRLPDGQFRSGKGYPAYNNESLSQLRDSGKAVSAIDGSTRYVSWKDFWMTLSAVVEYERSLVPAVPHPWINAPDYSGIDNSHQDCRMPGFCNPCDHPDHKAVGDALRIFGTSTYNRSWWVGYDTMNRPDNVQAADFNRKGEVFLAYSDAVLEESTANGNPSPPNLGEWYSWGTRDYARSVSWDQPDSEHPACGTNK